MVRPVRRDEYLDVLHPARHWVNGVNRFIANYNQLTQPVESIYQARRDMAQSCGDMLKQIGLDLASFLPGLVARPQDEVADHFLKGGVAGIIEERMHIFFQNQIPPTIKQAVPLSGKRERALRWMIDDRYHRAEGRYLPMRF